MEVVRGVESGGCERHELRVEVVRGVESGGCVVWRVEVVRCGEWRSV